MKRSLKRSNLRIFTALIQQNGRSSNHERTNLLLAILKHIPNKTDILLLPGGFYTTRSNATTLYKYAKRKVTKELKKRSHNLVVVLGIDGRRQRDQMALAIDKGGITSIARKFYPTSNEEIYIANDYMSQEFDHDRIIKVKRKRIYLAVCYDTFGIRHLDLENPGVDMVLNLIHIFYPKGQRRSGESYFVRHGLAGASKQWSCPVFGATVFYQREIPVNFQSGVTWSSGYRSTQQWKYKYNRMKPIDQNRVEYKRGYALLSKFIYLSNE
ncbi:MAG: hypothetical protein IIA45_02980 [Bacteroidetes bacterium]|nr:hypothetical protein [Bacteroidota bacterium]